MLTLCRSFLETQPARASHEGSIFSRILQVLGPPCLKALTPSSLSMQIAPPWLIKFTTTHLCTLFFSKLATQVCTHKAAYRLQITRHRWRTLSQNNLRSRVGSLCWLRLVAVQPPVPWQENGLFYPAPSLFHCIDATFSCDASQHFPHPQTMMFFG